MKVKVKNTDENYRKGYNYVNIMINAQTGEVYDYKTKNKKEMFCPDIKRWSNWEIGFDAGYMIIHVLECVIWKLSKQDEFASKKGDFATSLGEKENIM